MSVKRVSKVLLSAVAVAGIVMMSGCGDTSVITVNDVKKEVIGTFEQGNMTENSATDKAYSAYLDIVADETLDVICNIKNCTEEEAEEYIKNNNLTVDTYFDREVFDAVKKAYEKSEINDTPFGCAITDLRGSLRAVFSSEWTEEINYATTGFSPYSSFKPLAVYAPAIESKTANWSTVYEDSPYTKVQSESGELVNWPENASGVYSNEKTTVKQAIKESLNTVAVKCLDDYGVENSIDFLTENFKINLDFEKQKAENLGENEVIGNIAMGYLYQGVSPVDMAGYYQIFANGGKYNEPRTIHKITTESGNDIYRSKVMQKQVISEQTSFIMNELLQEVLKPGGTASDAFDENILAGGKTGTGTANDCHWFVGFVPQYSCAVWHGGSGATNYSPSLFKSIMQNIGLDQGAEFPQCDDVKEAVYCTESGLLCTQKCSKIDMGFYFADENLPHCKIHQKKQEDKK